MLHSVIASIRPKQPLGFTWSSRQAAWLGIESQAHLQTALGWPEFSYVRLGAYWNEIESQPNHYDFSEIEAQLKLCRAAGKRVVVTVGAKAPRWPEFFIPEHYQNSTSSEKTRDALQAFIKKTIKKLRKYHCITHWQIENEPLDRSGPTNAAVELAVLEEECQLVRSLDDRPLIVTLWGNSLSRRKLLPVATQLADVVGIDLYYRVFWFRLFGRNLYRGPNDSDERLRKIISASPKPIWITELQAEPWEHNGDAFCSDNPRSCSPQLVQKNLTRAAALPVQAIFLWGAEYWMWKHSGNK